MRSQRIMRIIAPVVAVAVFAALVVWLLMALGSTDAAADRQRLAAVTSSIENSITLCYSIEGAYPPDIDYLTENYGVHYDSSRYIVHYECFASNVRPVLTVIEKG